MVKSTYISYDILIFTQREYWVRGCSSSVCQRQQRSINMAIGRDIQLFIAISSLAATSFTEGFIFKHL